MTQHGMLATVTDLWWLSRSSLLFCSACPTPKSSKVSSHETRDCLLSYCHSDGSTETARIGLCPSRPEGFPVRPREDLVPFSRRRALVVPLESATLLDHPQIGVSAHEEFGRLSPCFPILTIVENQFKNMRKLQQLPNLWHLPEPRGERIYNVERHAPPMRIQTTRFHVL